MSQPGVVRFGSQLSRLIPSSFNNASRFVSLLAHSRSLRSLPQLIAPAASSEIDTFLSQCKPSKHPPVPWIWVRNSSGEVKSDETKLDDPEKGHDRFQEEGAKLVEEMMREIEEIKVTAPVRAKKGVKSQKQLREDEYVRFNDKVEILAKKHGVLSGKWLFFPASDTVDQIWSKIVRGLAEPDGALAKTGVVHVAKVSPGGEGEGPHPLCVYVDDSWNKEAVGKAFTALVEGLGLVSAAYKTDAFTILDIDSKHPSGIRSSKWTKNDFMTGDQIAAALEKRTELLGQKPKEVKKKTIEEERLAGLDDFDEPETESDEDEKEPVGKKRKV